jgi:hypothetical protein
MKYENVCITILHDMLFCGLLIKMVIKQSDRIACPYLGRGWSRGTQEHISLELCFFSNCSEKQPSGWFCLDLDWHLLYMALWPNE